MTAIIRALEQFFGSLPLPLLEGWGLFAYVIGLVLAVLAFGGFTFAPDGHAGLGRERQSWGPRAVLAIPLTFVAVVVSGYLGSSIVLVPGAQTLECLKDLAVFVCITLFGYPALVTVPFAYGLSDLVEGVPPAFLLSWLPGYFINPAFFWMAYQLIGRDPDFRRARTWSRYALFVVASLLLEPVLWGYICAGEFTPAVSYRMITSALVFTTGLTWLMAPPAMLIALPLARRFGMFRAESDRSTGGWPIQILILAPFTALILALVSVTAYVALTSAEEDAARLAMSLHEEAERTIQLQIDDALDRAADRSALTELLRRQPIARRGLAVLVDRKWNVVASSGLTGSPPVELAIASLQGSHADRAALGAGVKLRYDVVTAQPLGRETWLARAVAYDRPAVADGWSIITAVPGSYYLAGVRTGNSRTGIVLGCALLASITAAAFLSSRVTRRLRRLSEASSALAAGDLAGRVPGSRIDELDLMARSFNAMAERLQATFEHRARAEDALKSLNETLERRVAERTAELEAARSRAESADRVKSAFLATMSHELRTPLNSIIGFTGIILQGLAGPLTDEQEKQLGMVKGSARHLLDLINDVLDLSKIEADQLVVRAEAFDLRDALTTAAAGVQPLAAKKGLALSIDLAGAPPQLNSDRRRVEQIVLNLLNNAIKFTDRGSVQLTAATQGAAVRIRVQDTGIGMRADELALLFQPFKQLDSGLARQHEGTGLGLAICHRLAGLLGGTIAVESTHGTGSAFTVELPLWVAGAQSSEFKVES